jgi:hypothetical protein
VADTPLAGDKVTADLLNGAISDVFGDFLGSHNVATSQNTTSTSYTDLATVGPTTTITSRGTKALVIWACTQFTTSGSCATSAAVSGATTVAAADSHGTVGSDAGRVAIGWAFFTINPGSNTYTLKYRVSGGTGTFLDRRMLVWAP